MNDLLTTAEKQAAITAHVWADRCLRAVRWAGFAAMVVFLIAPMVQAAARAAGLIVACIVGALLLACVWHIKPSGPSAAKRMREIDARFKAHD